MYDLIVLGAGSGGLACAKRASSFGMKTVVIEKTHVGGTCVNVGCVPKKIMFNGAHVKEILENAKNYGFDIDETNMPKFSWEKLKENRDVVVQRNRGNHEGNLGRAGVDLIRGFGKFVDEHTISVDHDDGTSENVTGRFILIATGGRPRPCGVPGDDLTINSDGFFELEKLPGKVAVIGAGYIAVELACILHAFGSKVDLFVRYDRFFRTFDHMLSDVLMSEMKRAGGPRLITNSPISSFERDGNDHEKICIRSCEKMYSGYDCVVSAIGRLPNIELDLEKAGIKVSANGFIGVDDTQKTSCESVYAIGDVCGKYLLTPVAIRAGRVLAARLFSNKPFVEFKYENVPTVIFTHPPIGTIGFSEQEAKEKFGEENIKIYTSRFCDMFYTVCPPEKKIFSNMKLVCLGKEEKVIGCHLIGINSDEMLQGFAVAIGMGATKKQFDTATVAIHPTSSEEMVTMNV